MTSKVQPVLNSLKDLFGRRGWAAITYDILLDPEIVGRREGPGVVAALAFYVHAVWKGRAMAFKGTTPDPKRDFIERIQNRL
jgi:hypothetical protein